MDNERTEEYLEAIYRRQRQKVPVSTSSLATDLKVSPPAVTDMLRHLETKRLIDYKANKGTVLTSIGMEKALGVIRRHRLWERFLTDILGLKWDKVHEEACKLEHIASADIEKGLASILGDADTCPHGHSIPDINGIIKKDEETMPLSGFHQGQKACIQAIAREDSKILRDIGKLGLQPGSVITVLGKNNNGSIEVEANTQKIWINNDLAAVLLAKPVAPDESTSTYEELPLSRLPAKHTGIMKSYTGKRGMLGRCLSLGFTPGSSVKVLENFKSGPILVKIHGTEVAIGRVLADKIIVSWKNETC
jgi:DtxR family Mn-dependent transcriptional regulator